MEVEAACQLGISISQFDAWDEYDRGMALKYYDSKNRMAAWELQVAEDEWAAKMKKSEGK